MSDNVHLAAGVAEDDQAIEAVDKFGNHFFQRSADVTEPSLRSGSVVRFARGAEYRGLRLEGVDAVERFDQRKYDVAIVHWVGDRRGERIAKGGEQVVVARHGCRLSQRLSAAPPPTTSAAVVPAAMPSMSPVA